MQILLVVFNQLFRMVLENVLSQHGLNVRAVRTPDQAADSLDEIDLLITDFHFPDEVGNPDFEVTARLCEKARRIREGLPIVILTNIAENDIGRESILLENDFPDDLQFFDIVLTAPERIVEYANPPVHIR